MVTAFSEYHSGADPEKAAVFLRRTIEGKRKALGLDARSVD